MLFSSALTLPTLLIAFATLATAQATPTHDLPRRRHHEARRLYQRAAAASVASSACTVAPVAYTLPEGWTSKGCVSDTSSRLLPQALFEGVWTAEDCISKCSNRGYTYAGIEWTTQCYCGTSLSTVSGAGAALPDSSCSVACSDGSGCGGFYALSLYAATAQTTTTATYLATAASVTWPKQGCVTDDSKTRSLSAYSEISSVGWTVNECISLCQSKGYAIAGLEVATQCFCDNSFAPAAVQVDESECSWYCFGTDQKCGGSWRLSVYSTSSLKDLFNGVVASPTTSTKAIAATSTATSKATTSTSTSTATSTSTSAATVSTPKPVKPVAAVPALNIPSSSGTKAVYAHFMVGNTYPYTYATWLNDIRTASAAGLDGFALNIGSDSWQWAQVATAYQAAADSATGFKLFISFDMTVNACGSYNDGAAIRNYITTYGAHPNQAWYQGEILASTFAGSDCSFGAGNWDAGWNNAVFLPLKALGLNVFFMPSVFTDPSSFAGVSVLDGELNWNSGWPMSSGDLTFAGDQSYIDSLGSKKYMAAVSPGFFTHYGVNTWNKNWLFRSDDWLFSYRWESLIANRNKFDLIEVLTWNDYGESSYVGPIEGAQPNSQAWVDGYDHTPLLAINQYYATAFKTGKYPTIDTDTIYLTARTHPRFAVATSDSVPTPTHNDWTDDNFYALIFATAASQVTLQSGAGSQSFDVPAGITRLEYPLATGSGMSATISRSDSTVVSLTPSDFLFVANPPTYNFNYKFYGSS